MKPKISATCGLLAFLALVAACGQTPYRTDSATRPSPSVPDASSNVALDYLRGISESTLSSAPDGSITDLLTNTKYEIQTGELQTLCDAVVVGDIIDVQPGVGFTSTEEDPNGTLTTFDDSQADWRTVHLRVKVSEVLSGKLEASEVTVGLGLGADFRRTRQDLLDLPTTVFFLFHSPVYAYDNSLYALWRDGTTMTLVDNDGMLSMPGMDQALAAEKLRDVSTLDDLRAAAKEPDKVIKAHLDEHGRIELLSAWLQRTGG
jgi:hypothetical protein